MDGIKEQWENSGVCITESFEDRVSRLEKTCLYLLELKKEEHHTTRDVSAEISTEKIDSFVDSLLANESNNLGWVPDGIEKSLNRRIIYLALGALREALLSASVEVVGAKLTFSLKPEEEGEMADVLAHEDGKLDEIVKVALGSILSSANVKLLGHEIGFHLQ